MTTNDRDINCDDDADDDAERGLTRDAFLGGRAMLLQPKRGYRAGIDAVFLAATAKPPQGGGLLEILDAGAGVGTVGILAAMRLRTVAEVRVTLLERSPELAALARRNVTENALSGGVSVVEADLLAPAMSLETLSISPERFDLVLVNPPFFAENRGTISQNAIKAGAHAMAQGDLEKWARVMARLTRAGGEAVIVHRAEALQEVIAAFAPRFGALKILPLHPREGAPASRILVKGTKGSRGPLTLLAGFNLHGEGNAFTAAAQAVLREGDGLCL